MDEQKKNVCKDCGYRGSKSTGCKGWCAGIGVFVPRKQEACEKFWNKRK